MLHVEYVYFLFQNNITDNWRLELNGPAFRQSEMSHWANITADEELKLDTSVAHEYYMGWYLINATYVAQNRINSCNMPL